LKQLSIFSGVGRGHARRPGIPRPHYLPPHAHAPRRGAPLLHFAHPISSPRALYRFFLPLPRQQRGERDRPLLSCGGGPSPPAESTRSWGGGCSKPPSLFAASYPLALSRLLARFSIRLLQNLADAGVRSSGERWCGGVVGRTPHSATREEPPLPPLDAYRSRLR